MDYEALRSAYEADGCVRAEGALSQDWIDALTQRFDAHMDLINDGADLPPAQRGTISSADGDINLDLGLKHLRNAVANDDVLWRWAEESPAAEIVGQVIGADSVQYWYDIWFCKETNGGSATPWHHDASGHPFTGAHMPSLWVALTDVGDDDAPLLTFRGSHQTGRYYRPPYIPGKEDYPTPADYGTAADMIAEVEAHPENIQTWTCKAGDVLVIHPMTWHASKPQIGEGRRRLALTTRWIGSDLYWDPKPFSYNGYFKGADDLQAGDTAPVAFLPVLWQRETQSAA